MNSKAMNEGQALRRTPPLSRAVQVLYLRKDQFPLLKKLSPSNFSTTRLATLKNLRLMKYAALSIV